MKKEKTLKKILIGHMSTIPHYRVPFYQALERLRPREWKFSVIYDLNKDTREKLFKEKVDENSFSFGIEPVETHILWWRGKKYLYQTYLRVVRDYDLIVIQYAIHNLSYLFTFMYRYFGKQVVFWGHSRDLSIVKYGLKKRAIEGIKLWMAKRADGFFAYTPKEKESLVKKGLMAEKIFVLDNTIDIKAERKAFRTFKDKREGLRKRYGLQNKKVLLYVGRLNRGKRLDFLAEAFAIMKESDPTYILAVIGEGDRSFMEPLIGRFGAETVKFHGAVTEPEKMAPVYITSDVYVFPGNVGLGPLQALCYDVTPVVIDSPTHNPEYEYLNEGNAIILPRGTTPEGYANAIADLFKDPERWQTLKIQAWPSIQQLTIQNMAACFIHGINTILGRTK